MTTGAMTRRVSLFVEGVSVGEAYCPAFMGRRGSRVGSNGPKARRWAKGESCRICSKASPSAHARREIEATKKQRRRATREREYSRQLDRQREDVHPTPVLEALATIPPPPP